MVWLVSARRAAASPWLWLLFGEHERIVPVDEPLIGWYAFTSDLRIRPRPGERRQLHAQQAEADKRDTFFADEFADVCARRSRG